MLLYVRSELETGTDCYILTPVLLTIAALLSHPGWAAQPWVTEGPSPLSGAGSHSASILSPLELTDICVLVIFLFDTHLLPVGVPDLPPSPNSTTSLSRWYSDIFDWMHLFHCSSAYLHRCISWLTTRSRFNMLLHDWISNSLTLTIELQGFTIQNLERNRESGNRVRLSRLTISEKDRLWLMLNWMFEIELLVILNVCN